MFFNITSKNPNNTAIRIEMFQKRVKSIDLMWTYMYGCTSHAQTRTTNIVYKKLHHMAFTITITMPKQKYLPAHAISSHGITQ